MQRISILRNQTLLVLLTLFALIGLVLSSFGIARAQRAQLSGLPADQVAVKLKSGVSINTILARYHASLLGKITETNLYFLQLPSGQTADQVLPTLNADTDLWYAEPNYYVDGTPGGTYIMFGSSYIMFGSSGNLTPTPPGMSDQWAWIKTGLANAQKISTGQGIIVAVLDTGLTPDHPLLSSSITAGYDFVDMNTSISDVGNGLDDNGNGLVDEAVGHGTHISGIIETEAPGVQIMPIRVLNSDGVGTYWEVAAGIRYAVDHGAKVINMSMSAPSLTPSLSDALSYAASHRVIVVAAAGTDAGPNFPSAYPDKLAVLGVGATDQYDNIASFSGGQPADTDVFAPGVRIYSAYAYNGYAYGSGTSMAAPIVAAEAALLMSRHPDWSATEVTQRILASTVPIAGSTARRIDLASALSTGVEIDHASPDLTALSTDEYILPRLRILNNTPQGIPLSELTIRYWYTIDGYHWQTFLCDYATIVGCSNLTGTFTTLASNSPNKTSLSDTYLEVSFPASAGSLAGGAQIEAYLRILKTDLSRFDELNDYSYDDPTKPDMTRWNRITVYRKGVLVWGVEPSSSIPTPSPVPTKTGLPTLSTATRTRTPTRTSTLANSTATPTVTPASSGSDPCASPTVITGSGSYAITTRLTCFKYVNSSFKWGGMFTVINSSSPAANILNWYGGLSESVNSCVDNTRTLSGNGTQLNNFTIAKASNGAMFLIITGSATNTVSITIQNWQNGTGCSVAPTPHP
jgi:subtilisin family serine protease